MCPYEPKHTEGVTTMSGKISNELKIAVLEKKVSTLEKTSHEPQDYREKCEEMEKRIKHLEETLNDFMDNWGPEVQKRRDERDAKWDEMVSVLTIQKRNEHPAKPGYDIHNRKPSEAQPNEDVENH